MWEREREGGRRAMQEEGDAGEDGWRDRERETGQRERGRERGGRGDEGK